jgi:pimeloyl-ACP methyl ester carboxylesterase
VGKGSAPRMVLLLVTAAALVAACDDDEATEPAAQTSQEVAAPKPGSLDLEDLRPCGKQPVPKGYRCGELAVAWERAEPELGTTTVGFAVRERDRADQPSEGAIFALEGGPGFASTGTAHAYEGLFGDLLERRELVLVDQRGTGLSEPIHCPDVQRGRAPEWIGASECARRLGPRFESYRTSATADDVNDVREALGYDEITMYGDSYGTYWAQSYAFRHGETLNAMVVDSAYPARNESAWYGSLTRTGVRSVGLACERVKSCTGDARARLDELVDFMREQRRDVGLVLEELQEATYGTPRSYVELDRAGTALRDGNPAPWRDLTRFEHVGYRRPTSFSLAQEFAVSCNDYPMLWDKAASEPERREQLEENIRAQRPGRFQPFTPREQALAGDIGYLYCLTWPPPTELYEPPISDADEPTEAPVLVVNGEMDSLTTPHEAKLVADEFPNSELYIAHNGGHVNPLYYRNGKAAKKIRSFLTRVLDGGL